MGSSVGVEKVAAGRVGLTLKEYRRRRRLGLKRCTKCKAWKPIDAFDLDQSRGDGLTASCIGCRRVQIRRKRVGFEKDKKARQAAYDAIRHSIRRGRLARPTTLPCLDCGGKAREYHHHIGYARRHRLDVVALCKSCHLRRHWD